MLEELAAHSKCRGMIPSHIYYLLSTVPYRVLVLSRPMLAEIDRYQAAELALQQLPEQVNVVSLCYNAWTADTRTIKEKEADPKVLDIGWTSWSKPAQWNNFQLTPSSTTHIRVQEYRFLGNPGLKRIVSRVSSPPPGAC